MTTPNPFNKLPECDRCLDFREDNTRRWEQFLELDWAAGGDGVSYLAGSHTFWKGSRLQRYPLACLTIGLSELRASRISFFNCQSNRRW